jgi:O-antigen/teichoic acid export membrane protein
VTGARAASRIRLGIAWTTAASVVMGGLDVAATVLLLRLWLGPEAYGIAAVATTLFPMLDIVADAGITAAVIRRERIDDDVLATAWWTALATSALGAAVACALGAGLAELHGQAVLAGLLAAYGGKLVAQNAFAIPYALLRRDLRFGTVARIRMLAAVVETAAKLTGAALGAGVWCFVIAQAGKTIAQAIATLSVRPFWPRGRVRRADARDLLGFGGKTSTSQVLFHLYTSADYQIVGAVFGPAATGLYRAAYELVLEPAKLLSYIVVEVAFPVFSRLGGDREALRAQLLAFTRHNAATLAPVIALLAVVPGDLLALGFGDAWRPAGDAVRILCAVAGLRALSFVLPPLLDGVGRADLTLRYTVAAAIVVPAAQLVAALALGDALGWRAVAIAWAVAYPIAFAVLVALALAQIDLPVRAYARAAIDPLLAGGLALVAGLAAVACAPAQPAARVLIAALAVAAVDLGALAVIARVRRIRCPARAQPPS